MHTLVICFIVWLVMVITIIALGEYTGENTTDENMQFVICTLTPIIFIIFIISAINTYRRNKREKIEQAKEEILREREANKDIAKDFDRFLGDI